MFFVYLPNTDNTDRTDTLKNKNKTLLNYHNSGGICPSWWHQGQRYISEGQFPTLLVLRGNLNSQSMATRWKRTRWTNRGRANKATSGRLSDATDHESWWSNEDHPEEASWDHAQGSGFQRYTDVHQSQTPGKDPERSVSLWHSRPELDYGSQRGVQGPRWIMGHSEGFIATRLEEEIYHFTLNGWREGLHTQY